MTDRDLKPDNVRRTPEDVREKTDDAVWCLSCGAYLALDGSPAERDATAADFAAWHERTDRGDRR